MGSDILVCEKELFHMGKTMEIPIWYARKHFLNSEIVSAEEKVFEPR